jgi:hypothetical protein
VLSRADLGFNVRERRIRTRTVAARAREAQEWFGSLAFEPGNAACNRVLAAWGCFGFVRQHKRRARGRTRLYSPPDPRRAAARYMKGDNSNAPELKAVLFDMGDTIIDLGEGRGSYEERVRRRAARVYEALVAQDVILGEREVFCEALATGSEALYQAALAEQRGIDIFMVMRQFFQAHGLPADDEFVEAAAEAYCRSEAEGAAPLRKGAAETLAALKSRGLLLGAVSNTIQPGRFLGANMQR